MISDCLHNLKDLLVKLSRNPFNYATFAPTLVVVESM